MELVTYPDSEMMMIDLADKLAGELENALLTHDNVSFAVPGGTTPGPIFDGICDVHLDWDRVQVMLTDERWVDEASERSNTRLLRQRLLTGRATARGTSCGDFGRNNSALGGKIDHVDRLTRAF